MMKTENIHILVTAPIPKA